MVAVVADRHTASKIGRRAERTETLRRGALAPNVGETVLSQTEQPAEREETAESTFELGADSQLAMAGLSVLLSWYLYHIRGNRQLGLFVGLWPPTQLAFASYMKVTAINNKLEEMMEPRRSMMASFEEMFSNK